MSLTITDNSTWIPHGIPPLSTVTHNSIGHQLIHYPLHTTTQLYTYPPIHRRPPPIWPVISDSATCPRVVGVSVFLLCIYVSVVFVVCVSCVLWVLIISVCVCIPRVFFVAQRKTNLVPRITFREVWPMGNWVGFKNLEIHRRRAAARTCMGMRNNNTTLFLKYDEVWSKCFFYRYIFASWGNQ